MVRTVHVGPIQGAVAHAVYRVWTVPATEHDGRLADHGQHVDRRHVLRAVRRSFNHAHPIFRHVEKTLP